MRSLEYVIEGGLLKTKVDGKIIPNTFLDVKVIKEAVRRGTVSPFMKNNLFKNLRNKLTDHGPNLTKEETKAILARYEEEFQQ